MTATMEIEATKVVAERPAEVRIAEKYAESPAGTVIPYSEIAKFAGDAWPSEKARALVRRVQKRLLKFHNRSYWPIKNVGLRLVAANEHVNVAARYAKKARRSARRALDVTVYVRLDGMNETEKTSLHMAQTRLAGLLATTEDATREVRKLATNPEIQTNRETLTKLFDQ